MPYPTRAKIDMVIAAARRAGMDEIGSLEIGSDSSIRVCAVDMATNDAVEDEIEAWKSRRNARKHDVASE